MPIAIKPTSVHVSEPKHSYEAQALRELARRRQPVWRVEDRILEALPRARVYQVIQRLQKQGHLDPIERGVYRVVPQTGARIISAVELIGSWFRDEPHALIGAAAASYHGLILDSPTLFDVQLTRPKPGEVEYQGGYYRFTKATHRSVSSDNLKVETGRVTTAIATPEKLLVLLLAQHRTGALAGRDARLATEVFRRGLGMHRWTDIPWPLLILRHGNQAIARRLGFILEAYGVSGWQSLRDLVGTGEITNFSSGYPSQGRVSGRWRLRLNDPLLRVPDAHS
jgi:predicted transcriptional regulator of viral defense system